MRRLLRLAACALAIGLAPVAAMAQAYPSKDIHLICTFPPGSGADVLVRYFAEKLKPYAGGNAIVVENKAGAAGSIAAVYVARRPADGYTIMMDAGTSVASIPARFKVPPLDVSKDLRMVATVNRQAFMIVVRTESPFKTLQELTEHLKKEGDKATYASSANSGAVLGEMYKQIAGLKTVEVKYATGADSLNDLTSGRMAFGAVDPVFALSQARAGRLRVLAVGSAERLKANPDIPTLKEQGVDLDVSNWWSVSMPGGTPDEIVNKVNGWYAEILKQPETVEFLNKGGGDPYINTPADTQKMLDKSIGEWAEFIKIAKIPPAG